MSDVIARAVRMVDPRRIWLFGSQAAGTATRTSDVDMAFELPSVDHPRWAAFATEAEEEVPALVDLDLVDIGACSAGLAQEITRTGRLVYERRG